MRQRTFRSFTVLPFCVFAFFTTALAQSNPPPGGNGSSLDQQPAMRAPAAATTAAVSGASRAASSIPESAPASADPKAAINTILATFMINDAAKVPTTGKPLPMTGSWGVQTHFPDGPPQSCRLARVPCLKVVYKVPTADVICDWTIGYLVAVVPQADGSIKHDFRAVVLDENDAAADYTLRKSFVGDVPPQRTVSQAAVYPAIAQAGRIEGSVAVRIVVGPDGSVQSARAVGPPLLQGAALDAVRHWKFDPLVIGSRPTSFQLDQQFDFNAHHPGLSEAMNPSGKVMLQEADPRVGNGFRSNGASSGAWESCNTTGCNMGSPQAPQ
jgi:TonB family protein